MSITTPFISQEAKYFYSKLQNYPFLKEYWYWNPEQNKGPDFEEMHFDIERLKQDMITFNLRKLRMARFFICLWRGEDENRLFDFLKYFRYESGLKNQDKRFILDCLAESYHDPSFY